MTPILATIDPWILAFSAITVIATIWVGFWSARKSKTASDFFVAGRSVSVGWNASAISGEYLSAASFMGVAGMVMSSGYDALWYPVCYACGYLFLLLFIAGPLRRFGAYTIPDFAEGRFDSPVFRKIAVVFVLFIGFFYTMPQMKGAGTTLAYIFPGLPYWAGVVLVGAVITLNVALGGMKGITLVQAFQYWAKMFAISVPIFVLMAVYGDYGKQLELQQSNLAYRVDSPSTDTTNEPALGWFEVNPSWPTDAAESTLHKEADKLMFRLNEMNGRGNYPFPNPPQFTDLMGNVRACSILSGKRYLVAKELISTNISSQWFTFLFGEGRAPTSNKDWCRASEKAITTHGVTLFRAVANLPTAGQISNGKPYQIGTSPVWEAQSTNRVTIIHGPDGVVRLLPTGKLIAYQTMGLLSVFRREALPEKAPADSTWLSPFGPLTTKAAKAAKLSAEESKPYSLLYTYSLIIALVCGTAGLPHILVRFYTNPDGVAAKRTTMWVMILIGIFYVFPPVFGVMGRNLMPQLYEGVGAKGTDKVVLELPRILNSYSPTDSLTQSQGGEVSGKTGEPVNEKRIPWGSILSGVTCAGAFAAFMSTFSGLLVSMTGALAHDVYGRMLRPKSTPQQRMRAFKVCAVIVGAVAILLGMQVEPFQINFMVGQAFAIAAASYFPLLFMSAWWRGMTMRGAATGMLAGGCLALLGISLTSFSDLKWLPLDSFWAGHPLLRILCEQPAIWTVPLAITLMIVVSKLTRKEIPSDVRMKMLVLHAPEKLGLKQE